MCIRDSASGTTWTGGDRIGITDIGNDSQYGNVPFILKNGKFEAEEKVIYIEDAKTHTFRAYYPYNAAGGILTACLLYTSTTISNSLTELYLLFKYLRPKELERQDIRCFDAWAAIFAKKTRCV